MKRGLLLIDRGSKEKEVRDELDFICTQLKQKGGYIFANYCFLEVIPPYIQQAIAGCLAQDIDSLTIVPYFLYPGKKVKAAVSEAVRHQSTKVKFLVTKPMSMHHIMVNIVNSKIQAALQKNQIYLPLSQVDVLVIGHGSKDPNAKISIQYLVNGLASTYRNADFCFLEIEEPTIRQGISKCEQNKPEVLVVVFYFLHQGIHVKKDIFEELNPAISKSTIKKILVTDHIGTDQKMIDFIILRAKEVENANQKRPVH